MNETQYYTAMIPSWTDIQSEVLGYFLGDLFEIVGGITHGGRECYRVRKSELTDLTPVKFVPQDAAVVVEGFPLEYLAEMALFAERFCNKEFYLQGSARDFRKFRLQLESQLTPPKPLVEELPVGAVIRFKQLDKWRIAERKENAYGLKKDDLFCWWQTDGTVRKWEEIGADGFQILFNQPKSQPEEPKGFGVIVECNSQTGIFLSSRFRVVHLGNDKWAEEKSSRIYKYSELIDPIVLSEGQVK